MSLKIIKFISLLMLINYSSIVLASDIVNLLGEWQYTLTMKNIGCDGMVAKGTITFNADGNDATRLGVVRIEGDTFSIEAGLCSVKPFSTILGRYTGTPVSQTKDQYMQSKVNDWNRDLVRNMDVKTYTSTKIVEVIEYNNNMVVTWVITR